MNIGFCGAGGNMAGAIIDSLNENIVKPEKLHLFSPHKEKLEKYSKLGFDVVDSNSSVVKKSDIVFLCVKPQILPQVLSEIKNVAEDKKCFVSIAAGIKIETIRNALGKDAKVIRVMPNTPLTVGLGASGLCKSENVDESVYNTVKSIFSNAGKAVDVCEDEMDMVTAISGSGPAYVYRFVKAAATEAQKKGFDFCDASKLMVQTLKGAAALMEQTDLTQESLQTLIDKVTSPNGTTYAALMSMNETGFDESVAAAVSACEKRSKELSMGK